METPKTAEEILSGQPAYYFGASTYYEKEDVREMLEKYAEQARREERQRHSKIVEFAHDRILHLMDYSPTRAVGFSKVTKQYNEALAAAGYGKEETK